MNQWIYPNNSKFYFGGKPAVDFYNQKLLARRAQYPHKVTGKFEKEIKSIKEEGFIKWNQVIPREILDKIQEKVDFYIKKEDKLKALDEHYAVVADPFINIDETFEVSFMDHLVDFATDFFDCVPSVGTFNLRKSFVNNLPPKTTQLFHCDKNSIKFFKFFIYLNDVEDPSHGPLTLVKGSNNKKPIHHHHKHRWTEEEMINIYGRESIQYMTAKKGDLIAATTTGFHRGTKPLSQDRTMLTINFGIHPELQGGRPGNYENYFKITKDQIRRLSKEKRPIADFLSRV